MNQDLQNIKSDFELLEEWEDRYAYLIDLGKELMVLPESEKIAANKVEGCTSNVWLIHDFDGERLTFIADSDAIIVKGLIAVVMMIFSGKTPAQVLATNAEEILSELGLSSHLSPNRRNGLVAMVERMHNIAENLR